MIATMLAAVYFFSRIIANSSSPDTQLESELQVVLALADDDITPAEERRMLTELMAIVESRCQTLGIWQGERLARFRDWLSFCISGNVNCDWVYATLLSPGYLEFRPLLNQDRTDDLIASIDKALEGVDFEIPWDMSSELEEYDAFGRRLTPPPAGHLSLFLTKDSFPYGIVGGEVERLNELLALPQVLALLGDSIRPICSSMRAIPGGGHYDFCFVGEISFAATGHISAAELTFWGDSLPAVGLELDQEGAETMRTLSRKFVGERIAMILDDRFLTAPLVRNEISDRLQITFPGEADLLQAEDVAAILSSGTITEEIVLIDCSWSYR
jgi:type II secretory pathway component PulJ